MAEANPEVNQARRAIREALGVETLEVRQSLDTALQMRRQLAANRIVAMLDGSPPRTRSRDREVPRTRGVRFLRTPALLAYMTGAPILPCFIERIGAGRFAASARYADPSGPGRSARRRDPGGDAGNRGRARRPRARAPRVLVSLLPLLGRAAGLIRRPPLTAGSVHLLTHSNRPRRGCQRRSG